ncbi:Putative S-adenosyl-L-methionine-dependent methyltransferase superfamily [Colletotrichum destructivum]|uniref:S-adenosyl-L-methionine-dependent methyltransferase superfamily n=1 Tax=Colletotrichum destructivum TaxID=34406 RepID=A0AAX4J2B6_9PEZI|nr:Putative S-adenosyl-L-methionine-dependent methyltransferase superfamily [Colletotrichum destructivum]
MSNPQDQQLDHLVPDDEVTDSEVDLESLRSETTSIKNSILEYRIENGRSYHKYKDGKYAWPNDERENDRLDMQHEICNVTFHGRLGLAPPCDEGAKVGRVLDVGTGTGLWAIDYGDSHPEAEVLGVDLSPIQPQSVPPNVRFEVDDIEEDWLYSQPFDYIHLRFMNGSLADWKKTVTKAYDNLVPGGYLEIQDNDCVFTADDDTLPPEKPLAEFGRLIREAAQKFGRAFVPCPELKNLLAEIGFEDVALENFKWPSNPWPKDPYYKRIGQWNFHNFFDAAEALALAPLTRGHDWTNEEVQVFLVGVRKNMRDPRVHSYIPIYNIIGRKPLKEDNKVPPQDTAQG